MALSIDVVLFDMGGVLVELGSLPELLGVHDRTRDGFSRRSAEEKFWSIWLASPAVRQFERGECSAEEFSESLISELGLKTSPVELLARFNRFPRGLFPGAAQMVRETAARVTVGVLSNTNAGHWKSQLDAAEIRSLFDVKHRFLSFVLGELKPDAAIFENVVEHLEVAADRVLFLDDNLVNVEGARTVGMLGHVTKGVEEASDVLRRYALL